ncbi:NAD(P)/FAD-dependent oxidoreductase [uncultured Muribaculum sp.]|uniref:NAD(P)/FAD-dependent oxidoreductase n=1 Tax=uncultured Muribaculum sp. TaxID=1918613 RepID=UPI0025F0F05F|nr:FAD-dependent monooxygenase [uncultured Muribaculum sp.]
MYQDIDLRVAPAVAGHPDTLLRDEACRAASIDPARVAAIKITRRSIDARQRRVMVNVRVRIYVDETPESTALADPISYSPVEPGAPQAIVVGAGPAGLFAALRLIELGVRPVVVERGKDVDSRRRDMARIAREGVVDPDSNYCFGEGGAGAYSDGKLYTRSKKRGSVEKVLTVLWQHGASEDILVDAHPHIGTDRLPDVIKGMRFTIERSGGKVMFDTRVERLLLDGDRVAGVATASGETIDGPVILATGHSARDVYESLSSSGIALEPKGLAIGVRLEHPQELIDRLQYHSPQGRGRWLPPAEYSMLTRVDGRAVYSFCMCPGGFIIPAASAPGQLVVNGMSPSSRGGRRANSGMVVEILPEDVPDSPADGPLKMMRYQERIEKAFFEEDGGSQNAPAQRMADFVDGRASTDLPPTSYAPGIHCARIDRLLPPEIAHRLRKGFAEFGRKQHGFLTNEAALIGCETRTSSPVRIPRDAESLCHTGVRGLYPCGEGAGYAGGIVSAAIDGDRCATSLAFSLGITAPPERKNGIVRDM